MIYSPKNYWTDLADRYDVADVAGFAPILHPGTPPWFNEAIDRLQYRALQRALLIAQVPVGGRFLDVGCGTGRWVRRYAELGFAPVGVDATIGMLRIARAHQTSCPLIAGLAYNLPFSDAVFDCLSDITVVQHIPYENQPKALQEMVRVLKPGGRMILLELIRGEGAHIFPRRAQDWIREVESCGTTLLRCFGQEFLFVDRLFVRLAQAVSARKDNQADKAHSAPSGSPSQGVSLARRAYWQLRRMTVSCSAWTEPIIEKFSPSSSSTHAVFVFRKSS